MMQTALIAAACGLFLIALSVRVIALRRRFRISVGHQNNADLERAMRVQSNFVEYTPLFLILLALTETQGLPAWAVQGLGLMFLAGRALHFIGFRSRAAPGVFRVLGMALTFTAILAASLILPVQVFGLAG